MFQRKHAKIMYQQIVLRKQTTASTETNGVDALKQPTVVLFFQMMI